MSSERSKSVDKGQPPTEFSTLMLLLRAACMLHAKMPESNSEVSISTADEFGVDLLDDPLLAPLEALAGILVQHGEVIAASYTLEAGGVIFTTSDTLTDRLVEDPVKGLVKGLVKDPVEDSDVPDSVVPGSFMRDKVNTNDSSNLPSTFVITTNSYESATQAAKASNPHNLRVMKGGKDLWREFKDHEYRWIYAL